MILLGIHDGHNATAAVLRDERVISCASEERFTRIKNDFCHPENAINYCLSAANIRPCDIDLVVLATKITDPVPAKIKRDALYRISDYIREMHEYWKPLLYEDHQTDYWLRILEDPELKKGFSTHNIDFIRGLPKDKWEAAFNEERIRLIVKQLGIRKDKIKMVDHHSAHAHYAYYASPRDHSRRAAIISADSWGDGCNATISVAEAGQMKEVFRTAMCNIARIYRWTTLILGMKPYEHEYKVMGLAPYAKAYIREPAYKIYKETLVVDGLDFKWNKKPKDMYFYFKDRFEGLRFDGIAAGLQLWMEDLLSDWIRNIMGATGAEDLYFSGGLSMNVKANKVIAELPCVKNFYVPPSGGDESLAMGAAFVVSREAGEMPQPLKDAYLGYEPSLEESQRALRRFRSDCNFNIVVNPKDDMLADLLVKGKVLGRCLGKMEFGARSLGNRAILCDPSKYENLRLINEKIKFRDFWMPFTPSILRERTGDYLVNPKGIMAEYMTIAFDSTPLARQHLKAAIHPYDFSVRPQLVSEETNKEYYDLIKAFEKKTGIGGLLNTSLNLHGYPIVRTAEDAIDTLIKSGLDGMILPEILILKQ